MYARNANTIVHSNLQGVPFTSSVPRGLIYFPAGKSKTSQHPPSYSLLRQALNRAPRPRLPPRRQRIVSHLVCVPLVGFKQSRRQLPAFVLNVPQLTTNRQTDNRQDTQRGTEGQTDRQDREKASPRRADARLGSAHARNGRRCMPIEAVQCDSTAMGSVTKFPWLSQVVRRTNGLYTRQPTPCTELKVLIVL